MILFLCFLLNLSFVLEDIYEVFTSTRSFLKKQLRHLSNFLIIFSLLRNVVKHCLSSV